MTDADREGEGLRQLRKRYAAFLAVYVVIAVFVVLWAPRPGTVMPWLAIIAGSGLVIAVLGWRFELKLATSSSADLTESYSARFYLRIAVAEPALLIGFLGAMKVGPWWLYFVGALFSGVLFARAAPTDAAIARDQARLDAAGCTLDLVSALQQMPARKRG